MKRLVALTALTALALTACSGGGASSPKSAIAVAPSQSVPIISAYRVPLTHLASVDAAAVAGQKQHQAEQGTRGTSGLGGMPTIDMNFALVDAPPAGLDDHGAQINLAILGVEAIGEDGIAYAIVNYNAPVIINLLQFKQKAIVLGNASVPDQDYKTMRLVIESSASSVLSKNVTYPAVFGTMDASRTFVPWPSDISTVDFPVTGVYEHGHRAPTVIADFNAVESLSFVGGIAHIAPHIVAAPYESSAVIIGNVLNKFGKPVTSAIVAAIDKHENVAATTTVNPDGTFELHAINDGKYRIVVYNRYTTAAGVKVVANDSDSADDYAGPFLAVPGGCKISLGNLVD